MTTEGGCANREQKHLSMLNTLNEIKETRKRLAELSARILAQPSCIDKDSEEAHISLAESFCIMERTVKEEMSKMNDTITAIEDALF